MKPSIKKYRNVILSPVAVLTVSSSTFACAETPLDAAVRSYNSRNYRQAVTQFTALKAAYPSNALAQGGGEGALPAAGASPATPPPGPEVTAADFELEIQQFR